MTMMNEEISRLINNIEKELIEFGKYVKTIEEEYTRILPQNEETHREFDQKKTSRIHFNDENHISSNGLYEATKIAKTVLQRMYNLLDRFSISITVNEKNRSHPSTYLEHYFYNQYVCQMVAYLFKVLQENLCIFSEKLALSCEPKPQTESKVPEQNEGKDPLALKFKFFKPATLFTEDDKEYHFTQPKHKFQPPSRHREIDLSRTSETSSEESSECAHYRCPACIERDKRQNLVVNSVLKSLDTLVTVVQELLLQFRLSNELSTSKVESERADATTTRCHETKQEQKEPCMVPDCKKCCEQCNLLRKNILYQDRQTNKECKKEIHCYQDHSSGGILNGQDFGTKEAIRISPSPDNNQNMNIPVQKREKESIDYKIICVKEPESCSSKPMEEQENDFKGKEQLLTNKPKIHLFPATVLPAEEHIISVKGTNANQEKIIDLCSKDTVAGSNGVVVDVEGRAYPETVVFDVTKFSHLLKEKFKKTDGKSESKLLLDIVVTSLQESSDFKYKGAVRKGDICLQTEASVDTKAELEEKADKAVSTLVDGVIHIASQLAQSKIKSTYKKFGPQETEIKAEDVEQYMDRNRTASEEFVEALFPVRSELDKKLLSITHACISCLNMEESITTELENERSHSSTKARVRKSLTDTCFHCWNACQRGLTIHQCHFTIPAGILEIRHMDESCKIHVCFLNWDISKEPEDWRWQRNPFPDPTRVEIQQPATHEMDPVLKVIYGAEGTMVKESFGETRLRTIHDFPQMLHYNLKSNGNSRIITKSDSMTAFGGQSKDKKLALRYKKPALSELPGGEVQIFSKLSRFYDDIQKFGYGRGPPLILKLRKNYPLNDAYDLLMAPSKVRLHYYRNLRVIFVSDNNSRQIISNSNFVAEDQSNELFDHFSRKLFGTEAFHLFDYPSEEAHYMYLNPDTHTHPQWFAFAGAVLALAFLHQKRMNIKISSCLFKCLLDRPLVLHDLQSIDPLLYQKLMWLKENDVSNRKVRMAFVIHDKVGNKTIDNELMVNGRKIAVTEKNKYRYIELAVKWKLAERCLTQLKDFRRGFASVLDPCFLSMFTEKELLSVIKHPPEPHVFIPEMTSSSKSISRRGSW